MLQLAIDCENLTIGTQVFHFVSNCKFSVKYAYKSLCYGGMPYFIHPETDACIDGLIIFDSKLYSKDGFYKSKLPGTERDRRNIVAELNVEARLRLAEVAAPPELRKIVREARYDEKKWELLPFHLQKLLDENRNSDLGPGNTSCLRNEALLDASLGAGHFDWYIDYVAHPPSWHARHIKKQTIEQRRLLHRKLAA